MLSIILAKKIASLLILMALGFLVVKLGIVESGDSKVLSSILLYILCPCMIVNSFQIALSGDVLKGFLAALVMSFAAQFLFIGVVGLIRKPMKLTVIEQASIEYSNAGNILIPLVIAMFGNGYVVYSMAYICSTTILQWTHLISFMRLERKPDLKKVFTNINMIAIIVGLILFVTGIRFPAIIKDTLQICTDMLGPVAMLIAGMLLGGQNIRKIFLTPRTYLIAALRLVLFPLLALVLYKALGVENWIADGEKVMMISYLACCSCAATNIMAIAQMTGQDAEYASSINIVTTILCLITIPLQILLYQMI